MTKPRSLLQLICGQTSALLIVITLPGGWILGLFEVMTPEMVTIGTLVQLKIFSLATQYSINGHWRPRTWLLGLTTLEVCFNSAATLWFLADHRFASAMVCLVLGLVATALAWAGFRRTPTDPSTSSGPMRSHGGGIPTGDADLGMLDF